MDNLGGNVYCHTSDAAVVGLSIFMLGPWPLKVELEKQRERSHRQEIETRSYKCILRTREERGMILEDCKLIAELCDAGVPQMADMVIDRSKATVIVPCRASIEGEHERVDIHGTVLLLGLIDTHMHLFMGRVTASDRDRITMPAQWVFDCYNYARSPLDNDHTIIRDVGDEPHYSGLAMRNAINKGVM